MTSATILPIRSAPANPPKPKPGKPYPEFPLFPHATKRWAKKIRGKLHYFGPWSDPDGALRKYLDQKDDLHAGRVARVQGEGLTVRDLCIKFLTTKKLAEEAGELSTRSYADYGRTCERLVGALGGSRLGVEGFGQKVVGTQFPGSQLGFLSITSRDHQDGKQARGRILLDGATKFMAVQARHVEIGENQVGPIPRDQSQGFAAITSNGYPVAVPGQQLFKHGRDGIVVIDDQNVLWVHRALLLVGERKWVRARLVAACAHGRVDEARTYGVVYSFTLFQTCIHCPLSGAVVKFVGRSFPGGANATRNSSPLSS